MLALPISILVIPVYYVARIFLIVTHASPSPLSSPRYVYQLFTCRKKRHTHTLTHNMNTHTFQHLSLFVLRLLFLFYLLLSLQDKLGAAVQRRNRERKRESRNMCGIALFEECSMFFFGKWLSLPRGSVQREPE